MILMCLARSAYLVSERSHSGWVKAYLVRVRAKARVRVRVRVPWGDS